MYKKFTMTALLVFILAVITGCGNDTAKTNDSNAESFCVLNDDTGRTVTLSKKPERIVVVSASFLEPLQAVGGEVVGRPNSKNLPDFAKDAADIGAVYQIDTEKLLACTPDFVIINKGMNERLTTVLDENNIPFVIIDMKTYDNVKKNIEMFSEITGQIDKGKQIIDEMDLKIKNIVDKLPKETKRAAVLHSTAQGISVQLDNSIAGNVLKILGWENVAATTSAIDENADTAPYSLETLVEQNPEIIFITSMGDIDEIKSNMEKNIAENSAWQTIPAIQNNQLYYLPQDLFLLSPGVHYPEAVEFVAKLIYPEVFE